jgi:hypothetical protein
LNHGPSHRATLAVVHAPFRPVGYVLVHAHLLLPALWHDPAQPAPAIGGRVVVNVPYGQPPSDLPPLIAYPVAPEPVPEPAAAPPIKSTPITAHSLQEVPANQQEPEELLEEG